jgi:hypothetical protein
MFSSRGAPKILVLDRVDVGLTRRRGTAALGPVDGTVIWSISVGSLTKSRPRSSVFLWVKRLICDTIRSRVTARVVSSVIERPITVLNVSRLFTCKRKATMAHVHLIERLHNTGPRSMICGSGSFVINIASATVRVLGDDESKCKANCRIPGSYFYGPAQRD